jgi:hypothetical protein
MLGNVRSVGLRGATVLMIDSDRTTHLLRICAGQSGLPHVAVAKARAQRPRLSVEIGTGRLLRMIVPEPCVVRQPMIRRVSRARPQGSASAAQQRSMRLTRPAGWPTRIADRRNSLGVTHRVAVV